MVGLHVRIVHDMMSCDVNFYPNPNRTTFLKYHLISICSFLTTGSNFTFHADNFAVF